jgi:hypothetical protein
MNECLGLIAKGVEANKKTIQQKASDLKPFLDKLPEDDLALEVINTILNIAFAEK